MLLNALSQPNLDTRVTEALPWLAGKYADTMDWPWLVQQAKLRNLQNRLGFLLNLARGSGGSEPAMKHALEEMDRARLLAEATFCWDSMPVPARKWIRAHRSPEAEYWNIVSLMTPGGRGDANEATK